MAKVKIQGHASGTGVLTVTAPNTSTDRTITLPDSTGTLLNSDGSGANLTGLPNGSQLDHSGTKKIEAVSTGAQIQNRLEVITPNDSSTHLVQRLGSTDGSYGYVDLELVSPNSTAASLPRLDVQIGNSTVASFIRGGGIALGGTTASNTLDDYEDGTWTPTLNNTGGTPSYTWQNGHYAKIGNFVWLTANVKFTVTPSGATQQAVGGLPFASKNTGGHYFGAEIHPYQGFNYNNDGMMAQIFDGSSIAYLYNYNASTTYNRGSVLANMIGTTIEFKFTAFYTTT